MGKHEIEKAYILAGGRGTRLAPVLPGKPKCLAPINGKPFLHFQLVYLAAQGIQEVVLCGGYLASMIEDEFGSNYFGLRLSYLVEESPLGTGGALWNGLTQSTPESSFAVLNGDTMFTIPLEKLATEIHSRQGNLAVGLSSQEDPNRYGSVALNADGFVTSIGTDPPSKSPFPINSGVLVGSPSLLDIARVVPEPPFSLEHLINRGIESGILAVRGVQFDGVFIDIGLPRDYLQAATLDLFQVGNGLA